VYRTYHTEHFRLLTCDVPWHGGGLTSRGRKQFCPMQFVALEKKNEP
jgi:hypothetical protein